MIAAAAIDSTCSTKRGYDKIEYAIATSSESRITWLYVTRIV